MGESKARKYSIKTLGMKIRKLRNDRGWTLEQTEEKGGINWRQLQKIEAGKNIKIETLFKIAEMYRIHPSDILKDL